MPLSISLSAEVIQGINDAITAGMRANPGRGYEVGGILLGRMETPPLGRPVIHIEQFDPLDSEHRRGSSFVLSDKDKKTLGKKLAWWHGQRKTLLRPMGLWRSHTRRGLYLDNDDFSVAQTYFPEPYSVFLLVRPVPGASSVAGFFYWDDGDIHRESSYLEFPFDLVRLPLTEPRPVPVAPVAPAVSRPTTVMPPASRPTPVLQPASTPQPASVPRRAPLPMPTARGDSRAWLRGTAVAAAAVILFALAFYGARRLSTSKPPAAAAQQTAHPTPTTTAQNRPSPAVTLPIAPSAAVVAPSAPVSAPAVNPRPAAPPIEKPSPAKRQPGARPAPSPAPPPAAVPRSPEASPAGSASRVEITPSPAASTRAPEEPAAEPLAQSSHPPLLSSITTPERVARPPERANATVTVETVPESRLGRVVGKIPGLRRLEKNKRGFIPARPIRQIAPSVPSSSMVAREVPVDLRITVDPAGNVSNVEPASRGADQHLVRLASDAARAWQFEPARRNDETVSSELILHFTFKSPTRAEP